MRELSTGGGEMFMKNVWLGKYLFRVKNNPPDIYSVSSREQRHC